VFSWRSIKSEDLSDAAHGALVLLNARLEII